MPDSSDPYDRYRRDALNGSETDLNTDAPVLLISEPSVSGAYIASDVTDRSLGIPLR